MKRIKYEIEITYDKEVDMGYIYLKPIKNGEVVDNQIYEIQPDYDKHGRLIGIEVFDASHQFPEEILKKLK